MTATYTVGELFAGVGGFGMGFEQEGFRIVWQAEWDKHCQSILRRHWPDCALYGDVATVNGAEIAPVDVITFGSPCQDLSVAGKRAGLDGDRSSMFFQAIRIIKEMRDATDGVFPRVAVWENVPGALTSNKGADFGVVLDALADVGAVALEWAVLDARWFGVPQRRRRVFVVAVFDPAVAERCPDPLLPVGEGRRRDSAKGKPKGKDVATSLADRIGSDSGERVNITTRDMTGCLTETRATVVVPTIIFDSGSHGTPRESKDIVPTLTGRMDTGGNNTPLAAQPLLLPIPIQGTIIGRSDTAGPQGQGIGEPDGVMYTLDRVSMHGVAQPVTVFQPGTMVRLGGGVWEDTVPTLRAEAKRGDNEPHSAQPYSFDTQFGSNANVFTDLSPTLKATQASPSVATEYAVRRLTPLECERLMGWPDDHTRWTDDGREQADSHRYRQCGNGVATPVAAWVAKQIHQLFDTQP